MADHAECVACDWVGTIPTYYRWAGCPECHLRGFLHRINPDGTPYYAPGEEDRWADMRTRTAVPPESSAAPEKTSSLAESDAAPCCTRRGLTLGKFAPLHWGHQLVIETALAEMDEVVVIVYDAPETTDVPLGVRADWIRALYPTAKVIEAWDGPTEVGYTPEVMRAHEDYILYQLDVGPVTHFYSSEPYGEHMSRALGAIDRRVDEARSQFPISATEVRQDPFANREYLDPLVYRDLVANVVLLGAPSTGKSTLAERLAREFVTQWMPEYGREYWETHQVERRLTPAQLVEIAEEHLVREEALLQQSNRYLFTDTSAMTTGVFARYYHGDVHPRLAELADLAASRYDLVLLCDADIPYDDTWDRSGDVNRIAFQRHVIQDLLQRKVPYFVLRGTLDERVVQVRSLLAGFHKYMNVLDLAGCERP